MTILSSNDFGWNGFYNGKEIPSDDYWFKANLDENIIFSAHFALKKIKINSLKYRIRIQIAEMKTK